MSRITGKESLQRNLETRNPGNVHAIQVSFVDTWLPDLSFFAWRAPPIIIPSNNASPARTEGSPVRNFK